MISTNNPPANISVLGLFIAGLVVSINPPVMVLGQDDLASSRRRDEKPPLSASAILRGHTDRVMSVAFSPDGKTLASGSSDATVKLWDVATGTCTATLKRDADWSVSSVAFSPDGKTLAVGSHDRTVTLWEPATGKLGTVFTGYEAEVFTVAFSPDGQSLATGGRDVTMRLWDPGSGNIETILDADSLHSIAFSPDGKYLAAASGFDECVLLWDAKTNSSRREFKPEDGARSLTSVTISPDSTTLAVGSDFGFVTLWNIKSGKEQAVLDRHTESVNSVMYFPDGETLASAGGTFDGEVILWDLKRREPKAAFIADREDGINTAALSPDGKLLATAGDDRTVRFWNVSDILEHGIEEWAIPETTFVAESQRQQVAALWELGAIVDLHQDGTASHVALPYGAFSDSDLNHLVSLKTLKRLKIIGPGIGSAGLANIAGLTDLKALKIHATEMRDADMVHLSGLTKLEELALELNHVSEAGLSVLEELKNLRSLSLVGTNVTDLSELRHVPELETLDLQWCPVGDDQMRQLGVLENLRVLNVSCAEVTDQGLRHLGQLESLRALHIFENRVTDDGIRHLHPLQQLENLTIASSVGNGFRPDHSLVTSEGLAELKQALPKLKVFGLPRRDDLTDLRKQIRSIREGETDELRISDPEVFHLQEIERRYCQKSCSRELKKGGVSC